MKFMDIPIFFMTLKSVSPEQIPRRPEGFPGQRLVMIPEAIATQASQKPITRDLFITHIGSFIAAHGHWVERPNGAPQHILIACISGSGSCMLHEREWQVGPGDLLFLPPRMRHTYRSDTSSPWTIFWVHYSGLRAGDYLSALGVTPEQPVVAVDDSCVLPEVFEDIFRHVHHGFNESAMTGLSTAFTRLLGLAKVHQGAPNMRNRKAENRLLKALSLMRHDLARSWTLEELATSAAMSVPHFTELCRRQTGLPPLALLIRLRLQRAMDLLQQGSHNVTEAARAVGYEDQFYFSRLFRKHMGLTPNSCRNGP